MLKEWLKRHTGMVKLISHMPLINSIKLGGTKVTFGGTVLLHCKVRCNGKNNRIIIGKGGCLSHVNIHIDGDNNCIVIGDDTSIINGNLWIEDSNNNIVIGNRTHICGSTQLACVEGTSIVIGDDCLLSSEIVFSAC